MLHSVQDCAVLGDIVAREPDSIDAALERYERQRKPDVHALGTMDHQVGSQDSQCLDWSLKPCDPVIGSPDSSDHAQPLRLLILLQLPRWLQTEISEICSHLPCKEVTTLAVWSVCKLHHSLYSCCPCRRKLSRVSEGS